MSFGNQQSQNPFKFSTSFGSSSTSAGSSFSFEPLTGSSASSSTGTSTLFGFGPSVNSNPTFGTSLFGSTNAKPEFSSSDKPKGKSFDSEKAVAILNDNSEQKSSTNNEASGVKVVIVSEDDHKLEISHNSKYLLRVLRNHEDGEYVDLHCSILDAPFQQYRNPKAIIEPYSKDRFNALKMLIKYDPSKLVFDLVEEESALIVSIAIPFHPSGERISERLERVVLSKVESLESQLEVMKADLEQLKVKNERLTKQCQSLKDEAKFKREFSARHRLKFRFFVQETNIHLDLPQSSDEFDISLIEEALGKLKSALQSSFAKSASLSSRKSSTNDLMEKDFTHFTHMSVVLNLKSSPSINFKTSFELLFSLIKNDFVVISVDGNENEITQIEFRLRTEFDTLYSGIGSKIRPVVLSSANSLSPTVHLIRVKQLSQNSSSYHKHQMQAVLFVID